jgi:hypothetical protein
MSEAAKESIANLVAEARLKLDEAIARASAGEPHGSVSLAALARLQARSDNTSCQNTGCTGRLE